MANLNETVQWENGIYQWETTDPAQGGASGIMNTPTRQLANRTAWLKSKIGGFGEVNTIELDQGLVNINASNINKFIILNHSDSGQVNITLPNGATGNKIAFFFNSSVLVGESILIDGLAITLHVGDYIEILYTGATTRIVTTFTGWGCASVEAFARNTPPDGYLACNGAAVSRTTYARLFARIGTTFGAGNGTTTFNVPDLRGEFIRGWDNGRGIDSGRVFGSAQAQDIQAHNHQFSGNNRVGISSTAYGSNATLAANMLAGSPTTAPISDNTGGSETRPRNIALLYCIKF